MSPILDGRESNLFSSFLPPIPPSQPADAYFYVSKATIGSSESNAGPNPCRTRDSKGIECQVRS